MTRATEWLAQRNLVFGDGNSAHFERQLDAELKRHCDEKRALSEHISSLVIQASRASNLNEENQDLRRKNEALIQENEQLRLQVTDSEIHKRNNQPRDDPAQTCRETHMDSGSQADDVVSAEQYHALQRKVDSLKEDIKVYEQANDWLIAKYRRLRTRVQESETSQAIRDRQAEQPNHHSTAQASLAKDNGPGRAHRQTPGGQAGVLYNPQPTNLNSSLLSLGPSYPLKDLEQLGLLSADGDGVASASMSVPSKASNVWNETETPPDFDAAQDTQDGVNVELQCGLTAFSSINGVQAKAVHITNSSQSTEDENPIPKPVPLASVLDDSDEVLFVSTRPVNRPRRRYDTSAINHFHSESVSAVKIEPVKIKQENSSDRAEVVPMKRRMTRTSTMDLDNPGIHIITPRKRKRYSDSNIQHRSGMSDHHESIGTRCSSVPIADPAARIGITTSAPLKLERSISDPPSSALEADCDPSVPITAQASSAAEAATDTPQALQSISPNQQIVPRTNSSSSGRGKRSYDDRGAKAIHLISEDGETYAYSPNQRHRRSRSKSAARMKESAQRLTSLLEGTSPMERKALDTLPTPSTGSLARKAATSKRPRSPERGSGHNSSTRAKRIAEDAFDQQSPRAIKQEPPADFQTSTRADTSRHTTSAVRHSESPLRSRPLNSLSLDDFKLNPHYIGHDAELSGARSLRRCLPGCTRPCCTTAFRALVEAGAQPVLPTGIAPPSSPPSSPTPDPDQERHADSLGAADLALIAHHQGAAYSRARVEALAPEAQQALLLDARARVLGERHGRRHRRVWDRPRSPPGFWRADMPTTQEAEEDRAAAARMERERVRERWEDARRGGGRWVFRDE